MGLLKLTESERLEILNLHNNAKIIKEQATSLVSAAPAATAAPTDDKSKIMAIQTALNSKYGTSLKVDGILGQNTLTALFTAMKSKSGAAPASGTAAAPTTGTAAAPTTGTAAPEASTTAAPEASTTAAAPAAPKSNRDQRRERQDLRRGNRRAMQDLRGQQIAQ